MAYENESAVGATILRASKPKKAGWDTRGCDYWTRIWTIQGIVVNPTCKICAGSEQPMLAADFLQAATDNDRGYASHLSAYTIAEVRRRRRGEVLYPMKYLGRKRGCVLL